MAPRQCWQWPLYWVERVLTPPPPPTQGVHSAFLHLSGLKEGGYQFRLTVTDTKGQIDSVQVSVVVKAGWLVCW